MDLKDVVQNAQQNALEASSAFHAGHRDKAERFLMAQMLETGKYFDEKTKPAGDVTESATSEQGAGDSQEKPAQVPGAPAQLDTPAAAAAAQNVGRDPCGEKRTQ